MRVIKMAQNNDTLWKTEVSCTGRGWNQGDGLPCYSLLEVNQADLMTRAHTDISGETDIYFGFICPICGCFTEIPTNSIPVDVRIGVKRRYSR